MHFGPNVPKCDFWGYKFVGGLWTNERAGNYHVTNASLLNIVCLFNTVCIKYLGSYRESMYLKILVYNVQS